MKLNLGENFLHMNISIKKKMFVWKLPIGNYLGGKWNWNSIAIILRQASGFLQSSDFLCNLNWQPGYVYNWNHEVKVVFNTQKLHPQHHEWYNVQL